MLKQPIRKSAPPHRKAGGGCCFNPAKTVPQAHNRSKNQSKSKTSPPRHTLKDFEKNRKQTKPKQTQPKLHGQVHKNYKGLGFEQYNREKSSSEQFEKVRMSSERSTQDTSYKRSVSPSSKKAPRCRPPPNQKPINKCLTEISKLPAHETHRPKTFSGGAFLPKMVKITKPPPDQIQKVQILSPYTPTPMNLRKVCNANKNSSATESGPQTAEITKRRIKPTNDQQVQSLSAETFISKSKARRQSSTSSESDEVDERCRKSNSSQSNRISKYIHRKMSISDEEIGRKSSSLNTKFRKVHDKRSRLQGPKISNNSPSLSIRPSSQSQMNYLESTKGESGANKVAAAQRKREEKSDLQNLKNKLTDYLRYTDQIRSDIKTSGLKSIDIGSCGKAKSTYLQAADHLITSIEIDRISTNAKGASSPRSVEGSTGREQFSTSDSDSSVKQQQNHDPNFLFPDQQLEDVDGSECFEKNTPSPDSLGSEPVANSRLVFPKPVKDFVDSNLLDCVCSNQQMTNDYNNQNYMTTTFSSQANERPCDACGFPPNSENGRFGLQIPSLSRRCCNAQQYDYPSQDFLASNGLSSPFSQSSFQSYPKTLQPETPEKPCYVSEESTQNGPSMMTDGVTNHKKIETQPFGNPIVYLDSAIDRTNKLRGLFDTASDFCSPSTHSSNYDYDQKVPSEATDIPNFRESFENAPPSFASPRLLSIKGRILFNQPQNPLHPSQTSNLPNRLYPSNSNHHPKTQTSSDRCFPSSKCASLPPPHYIATSPPANAQAKAICKTNAENDHYNKEIRGPANASTLNPVEPKQRALNPDVFDNRYYATTSEGTSIRSVSKVACVTKTLCDPQGRLVTVLDQTTEQGGARLNPEALAAFDDFKTRLGDGFFLPSDQESQDGSSVYSEISYVEETAM